MRLVVLLVLLMLGARPAAAQVQTLQSDLRHVLAARTPAPLYRVKREDAPAPLRLARVSESKTVLLGTLRLYQATLSAQDMDLCAFTPSCSRFGVEVLQQTGLVRGVLLTADRLSRCHSFGGHRPYTLHPSTGKSHDPVDRYVPNRAEEIR